MLTWFSNSINFLVDTSTIKETRFFFPWCSCTVPGRIVHVVNSNDLLTPGIHTTIGYQGIHLPREEVLHYTKRPLIICYKLWWPSLIHPSRKYQSLLHPFVTHTLSLHICMSILQPLPSPQCLPCTDLMNFFIFCIMNDGTGNCSNLRTSLDMSSLSLQGYTAKKTSFNNHTS